MSAPPPPPPVQRPNILLITTDQQRFDTIHAAGNDAILTPHLDWLCDTGVRYGRAYSDCPVCAPARATIMSGMHAWRLGMIDNTDQRVLEGRPTIPGMLTAAGYQTRAIGKMHFTPMRAHYGFEHMEILPDYYRWAARQPGADPPRDHGLGENEMDPVFATTAERYTNTHWVVDRSIDFLETRDTTRPFFLWASFAKPHPPLDPLKNYWDLYDGIPLPPAWFGDWSKNIEDVPPGFLLVTYSINSIDRFSPQRLNNIRRAYYACISQIDYNLGLLFGRLRELGMLENTWIIFTSDHGEMLGDHHIGCKSVPLEGSAHVPLIVRPPRSDLGGTVDDRLACLADLLPTVMSLAGVTDRPAECDGLDLFGSAQRDLLLLASNIYYGALDDDGWKYAFTRDGGGELLFNVRDDPRELKNLMHSTEPNPAAQRTRLRRIMNQWLIERCDRAAGKDAPSSVSPAATPRNRRSRSIPGFRTRAGETDVMH